MSEDFLTVQELAKCLRCSDKTAYKLLRDGKVRGIRQGGTGNWRIRAAEVERYGKRTK